MIILTTVFGNLLVIIAVMVEKSLRTPSNYLIFSLAISDLIVGVIIMPLRSSVAIFGYWPFDFRCDLPFELEVMSSQASVLHLVAIAIDRYIVVSKIQKPNTVLSTKRRARIVIMIVLVWAIPALFVSAPFLGWRDSEWELRNSEHKCIGNYVFGYRVVGILITFYIPVPIILIFYSLIYKIVRKTSGHKKTHNIQHLKLNDSHSAVDSENNEYQTPIDANQSTVSKSTCFYKLPVLRQHSHKEDREKKVAKTLFIITSVFLLCWSPLCIVYVIYIRDESIPHSILSETIIWFGLCNSAMNPIIYAYFVSTFRSAFKKIVFRKTNSINSG